MDTSEWLAASRLQCACRCEQGSAAHLTRHTRCGNNNQQLTSCASASCSFLVASSAAAVLSCTAASKSLLAAHTAMQQHRTQHANMLMLLCAHPSTAFCHATSQEQQAATFFCARTSPQLLVGLLPLCLQLLQLCMQELWCRTKWHRQAAASPAQCQHSTDAELLLRSKMLRRQV